MRVKCPADEVRDAEGMRKEENVHSWGFRRGRKVRKAEGWGGREEDGIRCEAGVLEGVEGLRKVREGVLSSVDEQRCGKMRGRG